MKYTRCDACCGRKEIIALGNILKDCPVCCGIGFVEVEVPVIKRKRVRTPVKKVVEPVSPNELTE